MASGAVVTWFEMYMEGNGRGWVFLCASGAIAVLGASLYAGGEKETFLSCFPAVFAGTLIVVDLAWRAFRVFKLIPAPNDPDIIVCDPGIPKKPPLFRHIVATLFDPESGGQFYFILPVWVLGLVVIAFRIAWVHHMFGLGLSDK